MILTEEEAKTKWCPEARVGVYAGQGAVSVNRHPDVDDENKCIGSACMMWRRWGAQFPNAVPFDLGAYSDVPDGAVMLGYCGKAGKP